MIHVLGDVPSPTVLGAISDARSLEQAVLIIPLAWLASGRSGRMPGGGSFLRTVTNLGR